MAEMFFTEWKNNYDWILVLVVYNNFWLCCELIISYWRPIVGCVAGMFCKCVLYRPISYYAESGNAFKASCYGRKTMDKFNPHNLCFLFDYDMVVSMLTDDDSDK